MSEKRRVKIKDIASKVGSGATPRGGQKVYLEEGPYTLIRSQNVYDFYFEKDGLVFIETDHAKKLKNVSLEKNDILLNITGDSVGRCCLVQNDVLPARVNQHVAIIRTNESTDAYFLMCYLNSSYNKRALLNHVHGGTRKALTKGTIENFEIDLPNLEVQKNISSILNSLDNKIHQNEEINHTLEEMAMTLYKHWFVDFGPFQDGEFVESELGMIPEGWEVVQLKDIVEIAYGKSLPKKKRVPGLYPVYGTSGIVDTHNNYLVQGPGIVLGRKGTIGTVYFSNEDFFPIDTTYYITPKKTQLTYEILYCMLKQFDFKNMNNDSAVPGLNRNDVYNMKVVIPIYDVWKQSGNKFKDIFDLINLNNNEITNLEQTRDYLLPKLLSGKIDLSEAEETVESALN